MSEMQIPQALLTSLRHVSGFDESVFLQAHNEAPPVSIRINPQKCPPSILDTLDISHRVPWCNGGYYLSQRPVFTLDPALHAGAYYVQEASSMFIDHMIRHVVGDARGLKALDLCAAPGGKTTLLASIPAFSLVVANEIIRTRVNILLENVTKWGDPNVFVSNNDPADYSALPGYFDLMLVDAPCSGSGLFRKDSDAMQEWSPANVQLCAERQRRILADALPALREGGLLIYSTCSYSAEEDEEILDWLMDHADLEPVDVPLAADWGIVTAVSAKGAVGYRFFPGKVMGEGFFVSCFRLRSSATGVAGKARKQRQQQAMAERPPAWVSVDAEARPIAVGDDVFLVSDMLYEDHIALRNLLNMRRTGVKAGMVTRKEFVPDHELVMTGWLRADVPSIELDKDEALRYLRRQDLDAGSHPRGWYVVRYLGLALGLVKHLGNRVNNYYPTSWRILMS